MQVNQKQVSGSGIVVFFMAIINAIVLENGLVHNSGWYWLLIITIPFMFLSLPALKR